MARLLARRETPAVAKSWIARKSAPEIRVGVGWDPDRTRSARDASVRGGRRYAVRPGGQQCRSALLVPPLVWARGRERLRGLCAHKRRFARLGYAASRRSSRRPFRYQVSMSPLPLISMVPL